MMTLGELTILCQSISLEVMADIEQDFGRKLNPEEERIVRKVLAKTAKVVAEKAAGQFIKQYLK